MFIGLSLRWQLEGVSGHVSVLVEIAYAMQYRKVQRLQVTVQYFRQALSPFLKCERVLPSPCIILTASPICLEFAN